jgi:hypothetical protein
VPPIITLIALATVVTLVAVGAIVAAGAVSMFINKGISPVFVPLSDTRMNEAVAGKVALTV